MRPITSKLCTINTLVIAFFFLLSPFTGAYAACCAGHGGVASCNKTTGFKMCKDGTASPSCTCPKSTKATKAAKAKIAKEKVTKQKAIKAKTAKTVPETKTTTNPLSNWWSGKKSTTTPVKSTSTTMSARGCCSRHGGVAQCNKVTGHQMCKDGTVSATCMCR